MMLLNLRQLKLTLFITALGISLGSLYFEFVMKLSPCPLCIMQRLAVLLITLTLFISLLVQSKKALLSLSIAQIIFCLSGIGFALRQLYLQSLPASEMPSCGPGLNYLIKYFPLRDVMHALFFGSGECGEVQWQFLNLSMPAWSLLSFIVLLLGTLLIIKQNK